MEENMVGQAVHYGSYDIACLNADGNNYNTLHLLWNMNSIYRCTIVYLTSLALEHILCLQLLLL